MYAICFYCTLLFAVASCEDIWGLIHFNRDKKSMVDCIEDRDFFKSDEIKNHEDSQAMRIINDLVAEKFYRKTVPREELTHVHRLIDTVRNGRYVKLVGNQIPWERLEQNLNVALLDCSEVDDEVNSVDEDRLGPKVLPRFLQEKTEFGELLYTTYWLIGRIFPNRL